MEFDEETNDSTALEADAEPVKLVELKTETDELAGEESIGLDTDAAAPAEQPKEEKPEPADDSFDSLFANDEEEENPKASLIESLPDVSAQEILSDITELKEIMREGH